MSRSLAVDVRLNFADEKMHHNIFRKSSMKHGDLCHRSELLLVEADFQG
jgi:hypothetical protein